jgi:SH3-like domain-containing protein
MKVKLIPVAVALLLMAGLAYAQSTKQMSVTVRETQVRATPSYMGKILAVLAYGDRVDVLADQNGWARVREASGEGWVHLSALTTKQIVLQSGSQDVGTGASSGEVALAGKGFNQEVEAKYKQDNNLDYAWVDRMSGYMVTPEQVLAFLQEGDLNTEMGGAQ